MPVNLRPRRPTFASTAATQSDINIATHQRTATPPSAAQMDHHRSSLSPMPPSNGGTSHNSGDGRTTPVCGPSVASLGDGRSTSPSSAELLGLYGPRPVRAQFACDYCRQRKAKCSGTEPCDRCVAKKQPCSFSTVQNQRKVTRSLKDLHADRLGLNDHLANDPALSGGVRMYLERHAQRAAAAAHQDLHGNGGARRTVMSQGDASGHVNHWYMALHQQAYQRRAAASPGYVWPSSPLGMYRPDDLSGNGQWYQGSYGGGSGGGYRGTAQHGVHYNPNMASRSESDLSALGNAAAAAAASGGFSSPGTPTTPLPYAQMQPHTPLQATFGGSSGHVQGYDSYRNSLSSQGGSEPAYSTVPSNGWMQHRQNGSPSNGHAQPTAAEMGWRYEPLPPPPASLILGQTQDSRESIEAVSGPAAAAGLSWSNTAFSGNSEQATGFTDDVEGVMDGATGGHSALSAIDLGFKPPSPL